VNNLSDKTYNSKIVLGFKLYYLLLGLTITICFLDILFFKRYFVLFGIIVSLQAFFLPIIFYLQLLVSELYGYEYSRNQYWLSIFSILLVFMALVMLNIGILSCDINYYIGCMFVSFRDISFTLLNLIVFTMLNFLIVRYNSKIKLYLDGKYFEYRMLGFNLSCQYLYAIFILGLDFMLYGYNFVTHALLVIISLAISTVVTFILLPVVRTAFVVVKDVEGYHVFDLNQEYKIFKIKIDFNKLFLRG
jgi:hypothetical protein